MSQHGRLPRAGISIEEQSGEGLLLVEGYGGGGFKFQGRKVEGAVLVTGKGYYPLSVSGLEDILIENIEGHLQGDAHPELILFGSGPKMTLMPSPLRKSLEERSIGYDVMDTGAAARTYNVLLMEGRSVDAVLIPVD